MNKIINKDSEILDTVDPLASLFPFPQMNPIMPQGPTNVLAELRAEFPNLAIYPPCRMLNLKSSASANTPLTYNFPANAVLAAFSATNNMLISFRGNPSFASAGNALDTISDNEGFLIPSTNLFSGFFYVGNVSQVSFTASVANATLGMLLYITDKYTVR